MQRRKNGKSYYYVWKVIWNLEWLICYIKYEKSLIQDLFKINRDVIIGISNLDELLVI